MSAFPVVRRHDDRGFSLVELLVAAAVTGVVLPLVFVALVAAQRQTATSTATADAVDDVGVALASIDHRVRSASAALYVQVPTSGRPQAFGFFTDYSATGTRLSAPVCVQYRITPYAGSPVTGYALRTRTFAAGATPSPWTDPSAAHVPVVLTDAVAWTSSTATHGSAFAPDGASTRSVTVHLEVQHRAGTQDGRPAVAESLLAARNPAEGTDTVTSAVVARCQNFD